jgi:transcriptional regulator
VYKPDFFDERDKDLAFQIIEEFSFAPLITVQGDSHMISHLPFHVDSSAGGDGLLYAHMARANPHWKMFGDEAQSFVIFQGPHAYISPSWYEPAPGNVPTWNYAVVHVYGRPRVVNDSDRISNLMTKMVELNESYNGTQWRLDTTDEVQRKLQGGIVVFEIPIERIDSKFKLSQQQTPTNRENVIHALSQRTDPMSQAVSQLMEKTRKPT